MFLFSRKIIGSTFVSFGLLQFAYSFYDGKGLSTQKVVEYATEKIENLDTDGDGSITLKEVGDRFLKEE